MKRKFEKTKILSNFTWSLVFFATQTPLFFAWINISYYSYTIKWNFCFMAEWRIVLKLFDDGAITFR